MFLLSTFSQVITRIFYLSVPGNGFQSGANAPPGGRAVGIANQEIKVFLYFSLSVKVSGTPEV